MPEHEEHLSGLPEVLRNSNRPIIIYQGAPPGALDAPTSNALGLISWLALLTLCLGTILFCVWQVWNPGYDTRQFSPIYAEGRPVGLANQIEERKQINARGEGLVDFLDRLRAARYNRARSRVTHSLISDPDGIDAVRAQWDEMCGNIRERIYDRRLGQIDSRAAELRRRGARVADPAERAQLDSDLLRLQAQRADQLQRRRTDTDPALQCVRASEAPVCSESDANVWCNPELNRPRDFVDGVS